MSAKWIKVVHSQLRRPVSPTALLQLKSNRRMPSQKNGFTSAPQAQRRLDGISKAFAPFPQPVGTLKLGDITYDVPPSLSPSRLPRLKTRSSVFQDQRQLLDVQDPINLDHLHFLLQKYVLGQDVFLVSQPGPYARRLALTFARCVTRLLTVLCLIED